ncbi:MAG: DUF1592 domain-containing protein [Verrucomicrobiales bacterium]|nr:DUF1592 domain-containing protein [Verrucomicrobiales bacterium]
MKINRLKRFAKAVAACFRQLVADCTLYSPGVYRVQFAVFICGIVSLSAQPIVKDTDSFESQVKPFFEKHCIACHGPDKQKGKLRLDTLPLDFGDHEAAGKWIEVMDNINLGEMPPEDEPIPEVDEIAPVAKWIALELRHAEKVNRGTGGRVLLRRLSRTEYANTVRDLFNVEFLPKEGPLDLLPPDGTLDGFDKVSKALLLDPSLMAQYFDIAEVVANKSIITGPPPVPTRKNRMEYEATTGGIEYIKHSRTTEVTPEAIISKSSGMRSDHMLRHPWNDKLIPIRGNYTMRLRVGADPGARGEPLHIKITRTGDGDLWAGKVEGTIEKPQIIELTRPFNVEGSSEIQVRIENGLDFQRVNYLYSDLNKRADAAIKSGDATSGGRIRARMGAEGMIGQSRPHPDSIDTSDWPRVMFDWIELEGPLYSQWPPKSTETIFYKGLDESIFNEDYARGIFDRLLPRAFRRPVEKPEVDRILSIVTSELKAGQDFPEAIKSGVIATLCSPSFLLHFEKAASDDVRPLNDYEIANRLSYFLWSSMPDEELFELAAAGVLRDSATRDKQVERMLSDPKAKAFTEGFAVQWLKASEFDRFDIDMGLYRNYYSFENAGLNDAINAEPIEFFREILKTDKSALNFLDSDWTMANEDLARWYGIPDVNGKDFRPVKLPAETHRGGLTTMAAVHKWGSDGNRTKPVERGKYILEVLFNDPPLPPPPNVGEVEPNVQGDHLTVRQRLDKHRSIESCAACHRGIDPYGLALENFNVIGQWRTKQDGERGHWPKEAVIDPTGKLPNGVAFNNVEEYRSALYQQSDRFLRGLSEKMFTYALGRGVEPGDRGTIENLVTEMKANGETFRSLIKGIVKTEAFTVK